MYAVHIMMYKLNPLSTAFNLTITSHIYIGHQSMERSEVIPSKLWNLDWLHSQTGNCRGRNTVIAIIDGGVDITHNFLSAKYQAQQIFGCNFVPHIDPLTNTLLIDPNKWYGQDAQDPHGTAVAAIAGGYSYGVAPDAILYICRIFHNGKMCASLLHPLEHLLELKTSGKLPIDIISMSLGTDSDKEDIERLLPRLTEQGIVCVAAVGNKGLYQQGAQFPASDLNVLSIGALRPLGPESDLIPSTGVDVFAPGEDIVCPLMSPGSTVLFDGTSFATPMVAGFISLLLQCAKELPGSTAKVVAKYHDLRFLKQLFLNPHSGPCKDKKLIYAEKFLTDIINRPVDINGRNTIVSLITAVYPEFQP